MRSISGAIFLELLKQKEIQPSYNETTQLSRRNMTKHIIWTSEINTEDWADFLDEEGITV